MTDKEEKKNVFFRPRFLIIMLVAVVFAQLFSINYLKKEMTLQKLEMEKRLSECYDTMNTMSIMQGALVNVLVERNVLDRNRLLEEAQKLSADIRSMMEEMRSDENPAPVRDEKVKDLPGMQ